MARIIKCDACGQEIGDAERHFSVFPAFPDLDFNETDDVEADVCASCISGKVIEAIKAQIRRNRAS